jgi:hypothetical protein
VSVREKKVVEGLKKGGGVRKGRGGVCLKFVGRC